MVRTGGRVAVQNIVAGWRRIAGGAGRPVAVAGLAIPLAAVMLVLVGRVTPDQIPDPETRLRWLIAVSLLVLVSALFQRTFSPLLAPSLSIDEIGAMAELERREAGRGIAALTSYYQWRGDQWRQMARGFAAAAATLLVSVTALLIDASSQEIAIEATQETVTTTLLEPWVVAELSAFVALLFSVAVLGWSRTHVVHSEFASDLRSVV
jgi:hypothetical protein